MKLCLITEYFHPDSTGGTGTVLSELARYLKDHHDDLEIDVLTSKNLYRGETGPLPVQEDWRGIRITRLQTPKSNRPSAALRLAAGLVFTALALRALLGRPRYDFVLVVTNPPSAALAAWALKRLKKTPYLYLIHDLYPDFALALNVLPRDSAPARIFQSIQKTLLHSSDRTIVVGRCMADYLVKNYTLPRERIEVITNWSDPERIKPSSGRSRFRERNYLQGTIAMYAGNLGLYVNVDDILDAALRLKEMPEQITIVLVGDGAKRDHIASRIAAEELHNVQLFPLVPQDEYPDVLAAADISMVTLMESAAGLGVPSKFYNILASGQPTVALVAGDSEVARVLVEADCGVQVAHNDPDRLALVLAELAASPERLARMGDNARRACVENFTLKQVGEKFYGLFLKVGQHEVKGSDLSG